MSAVSAVADTTTATNLLMQILLGASLNNLWALINTLQFVVFFTEWYI